jgi:phage tail-like protein|tara:strand:+ start:633 stop:1094 length:462 start_codon:yes stop_codon:yes gene_type:complete
MGIFDNPAGRPLTNFHYTVDFGLSGSGSDSTLFIKDVGFSKVSGMTKGLNVNDGKFIGESESGKLILERGMSKGSEIMTWIETQITKNQRIKIPIIVTLLDEASKPIYSWMFFNAYPTKISLGELNSQTPGVLVETIEFEYDRYKQENRSLNH